jgi:hypothetical protein
MPDHEPEDQEDVYEVQRECVAAKYLQPPGVKLDVVL